MVSIETRVTGDVDQGLDRLSAKVSGDVLRAGASAMARVVAAELRVRTSPPHAGKVGGELADAVYYTQSESRSDEDTKAYHVGINRKKVYYWYFLEYGTYKMPAQPMVRPAYDSSIKESIRAGNEAMRAELKL